jgi:hypothetical protein
MTPTVGTSYRFGAVAYASGCPSHFEVWKGRAVVGSHGKKKTLGFPNLLIKKDNPCFGRQVCQPHAPPSSQAVGCCDGRHGDADQKQTIQTKTGTKMPTRRLRLYLHQNSSKT